MMKKHGNPSIQDGPTTDFQDGPTTDSENETELDWEEAEKFLADPDWEEVEKWLPDYPGLAVAELLYDARLREDNSSVMAAVRAFLTRISVHAWDEEAAEAHARIRVNASAIAAHAKALGATLVTSYVAVRNLKIDGLRVVSW
jgi:hypothetical protein